VKKISIALSLFSVLAASAFAQISFSGEVHAGIQIDIPYDRTEAETINALHPREAEPRFNLVGTVTREHYGARFDAVFQHTVDPARHFTLNGVYAWVNFDGPFGDDSLRLTMGQISSAVWVSSLGPDHEYYFDAVRGFRVEYWTPIPGLQVGAAFRTDGHDFQSFFKQMIVGASFVHPLFNAVFAYDLGGNANLLFGLNYTGMPDLIAGAQVMANHLASWDSFPVGMLQFNQKVGYRITRPLTVSLLTGQTFFGAGDRDTALFFTPSVSYSFLPDLSGTFSVEFFSADYFDTRVITFDTRFEYMLRGPALFYLGYELRLARYKRDSHHRISFGIEIRAF